MYDVIYIDCEGCESAVAGALERDAAAALARQVAAERGAGRIICPGNLPPRNCVCVVPRRQGAPAPV